MRLSPKSLFFGIVVFGLPFAVTVGWTLGTPADAPTTISAPGGSGSIGAAPARVVTSPVTTIDHSSRVPRTNGSAAGATAPVAVPAGSAASSTAVTVSLSPAPALTDPPVPTPTAVTAEPPSPSATPSSSATPDPGGVDPARLVRRP